MVEKKVGKMLENNLLKKLLQAVIYFKVPLKSSIHLAQN